ncbi:hypothetical protein BJ138DRAFT_1183010 [Hygrophoropsis aurantiaca]|uniref:Uncharacterized protein n=1 Tax=Hygrophoropsis aurantiaca TaxID=72124 RepID=A0ACB7ZZJ9_9AGAM|nr:hypothetical protein BJ138DRAFT_1183010 [Hygrophoropsis aurantiaca]
MSFVSLFRPRRVVPNTLDPTLNGLDWACMEKMFENCLSNPHHPSNANPPPSTSTNSNIVNMLNAGPNAYNGPTTFNLLALDMHTDTGLKNLMVPSEGARKVAERWIITGKLRDKLEVLADWLRGERRRVVERALGRMYEADEEEERESKRRDEGNADNGDDDIKKAVDKLWAGKTAGRKRYPSHDSDGETNDGDGSDAHARTARKFFGISGGSGHWASSSTSSLPVEDGSISLSAKQRNGVALSSPLARISSSQPPLSPLARRDTLSPLPSTPKRRRRNDVMEFPDPVTPRAVPGPSRARISFPVRLPIPTPLASPFSPPLVPANLLTPVSSPVRHSRKGKEREISPSRHYGADDLVPPASTVKYSHRLATLLESSPPPEAPFATQEVLDAELHRADVPAPRSKDITPARDQVDNNVKGETQQPFAELKNCRMESPQPESQRGSGPGPQPSQNHALLPIHSLSPPLHLHQRKRIDTSMHENDDPQDADPPPPIQSPSSEPLNCTQMQLDRTSPKLPRTRTLPPEQDIHVTSLAALSPMSSSSPRSPMRTSHLQHSSTVPLLKTRLRAADSAAFKSSICGSSEGSMDAKQRREQRKARDAERLAIVERLRRARPDLVVSKSKPARKSTRALRKGSKDTTLAIGRPPSVNNTIVGDETRISAAAAAADDGPTPASPQMDWNRSYRLAEEVREALAVGRRPSEVLPRLSCLTGE